MCNRFFIVFRQHIYNIRSKKFTVSHHNGRETSNVCHTTLKHSHQRWQFLDVCAIVSSEPIDVDISIY